MNIKEIILLREKLFKDEISYENAKESFFKENKKSWYTKDWKERRDTIIKDKCEQCGSSDGLTLQHFSHPKKYQEIQRLAFQYYHEKFLIENESNFDSLISKDDILNYEPV